MRIYEKIAAWLFREVIVATSMVIFSFPVFSQSYYPKDSILIYKWLNQSEEEAITGSLDTALKFARIALQVSKEKKMPRGEGFAKLKIADILLQQESPVDVNEFISEALNIATQLKDSFMMALACYQQGEYLMYKDQLEEAEKLFYRALSLKFEKEQSNHTALVYNDIGYLYGLKDELEKQVEWYLKAIRLYEKTEDVNGLASTTSSLAAAYAKLGNTSKAFEYTKEAIAIREKTNDIQGLANSYENLSRLYWAVSLDSASKYQQVAMKYAEKSGVKSIMIRSYDNLSVLMDKQRNKQEALAYIKKSIALCREMNDKAGLAAKCRWAALLCADLKDTIAMEEYYRESFDLSVQLNNKTLLRDLYGTKAGYYGRVNDYKNAYDNLKKYYLYKDSIISNETAINIAELETKYETEKKDNEIARLNTGQKIKQLEIEKQKAIISGNKLEAMQKENDIELLSRQQELRDARIKQQEKDLEKQLLLARNNEQEIKLTRQEKLLKEKELKGQKQIRNIITIGTILLALFAGILFNRYKLKKKLEQQAQLLSIRNDIARDLHDEIGSTLTSIKILSEVSQKNLQKDQQKASELLRKITEQSSQMQQGMSDIVWAIKPDNDKLENMVIRMREYASHTLEPKNIEVIFLTEEQALSQSLDMQQRRDFFLIFKEAINNAAKYSQAARVEIELKKERNALYLRVSDNGTGFIINKETSSNGLKNMKTRAQALQGSLEIKSGPGCGTTIVAIVPAT